MSIYKVIINNEPLNNYEIYEYKDSNYNKIKINEYGISIEMKYNEKPKSNKKIIYRCKKAAMIYLLKYGKIDAFEITGFFKDDDKKMVIDLYDDLKKSFKINQIIMKNNFNIDSQLYNDYLNMKSNNPVFIMINDYVMSNSKTYNLEKFIYSWMAFNSIYNTFNGSREVDRQLKFYNKYMSSGHKYELLESRQRNNYITPIVNKFNINNINHNDINSFYQELAQVSFYFLKEKGINKNKIIYKKDKILYGKTFLLIEIGYYYRCNLFHGSKHVEPFFENDKDSLFFEMIVKTIYQELTSNVVDFINSLKEENYNKYFLNK